jgi:YD repeat-containing protein
LWLLSIRLILDDHHPDLPGIALRGSVATLQSPRGRHPAGTTSVTYNQFGQGLTKTQVTGTVTLTVTYTYDAFGRLSSLKYPSGKAVTYSYDSSGRVAALSTGAGSIAHFPFGPAKNWIEPNATTYARTFDKDGRITGIAMGGATNVQTLNAAASRASPRPASARRPTATTTTTGLPASSTQPSVNGLIACWRLVAAVIAPNITSFSITASKNFPPLLRQSFQT